MKDKINQIVQLRKQGFGSKKIAQVVELSSATTHKWIKAYDLCYNGRPLSDIGIKIVELRKEKGLSVREIARALNTPVTSALPYIVYADGFEQSVEASSRDHTDKNTKSNKLVIAREPKPLPDYGNKSNIKPFLAELEIQSLLIKLGFNVFTPVLTSSITDLLSLSKTGKVTKIQIKSADTNSQGRYNFHVVRRIQDSPVKYNKFDVDVFVLVFNDRPITESLLFSLEEVLNNRRVLTINSTKLDVGIFNHLKLINRLEMLT